MPVGQKDPELGCLQRFLGPRYADVRRMNSKGGLSKLFHAYKKRLGVEFVIKPELAV